MHVSKPQDRIAFDLAASGRWKDADGHLHVPVSNISKANVCGYFGKEIPGGESLIPTRLYQLYRDPAEIEKGAASFNGKQLLDEHKAQSADTHDHDLTIGAVHNPVFNAPYLQAELVIWDGDAIKKIESREQCELSSSYRYQYDPTPGTTPEGVRYDGRMTGIIANHVAVVTKGRAGPDCIVGDSAPTIPKPKPTETRKMAKLALNTSRAALLASGAIHAYMQPKLAADAKLDINALVKGVGKKNWRTSKPKIVTGLRAATKDKLAADASLEDVVEMLDQLDAVVDDMPDEAMADPANVATDTDAEMMDRLREVLKAKGMSDEDIAACMAAMKPEVAAPEKPATDAEKAALAAKDAEKDKNMVSKPAMDAAIAKARTETANELRAHMTALRNAENDVRPVIGEVLGMDSVPDIYKLALDHLKVDHVGMPDAGLPMLLKLARDRVAAAAAPVPTQRVAMDAAAASDYAKRFPNANRLVR